MKLSLILCLWVCYVIVFFSVECYGKGGRGGGSRGGGSRGGGSRHSGPLGGSKGGYSGSSESGGLGGWFTGLFGGSKSSSTSSSPSTFSSSNPHNGKIGSEGLYSGTNHYSSLNNNLKPINTGKIGFESINSNKKYDKNDFSKFSEPKVNYNPYSPSFGRYQRKNYGGIVYYPFYHHHHPRYHTYNRESTSSSGHINESLLYNPCKYYGGFNNKPIGQTNDKNGLSMIHHDKCNTNSKEMKNTLSGPGFGMGLLGGAATGISLGMLLSLGLNSLGSTPWNHNNEAFNEWLNYKVERKMTGNPLVLGTMDEAFIIDKLLNQTKMCPGGTNILDASILNTLVPCNATSIKVREVNVAHVKGDECKSLSILIYQDNSIVNKTESISINIKQINLTTRDLFEDLSYDINIMHGRINSVIDIRETKVIRANSEKTINETMSYLETLNVTVTQFNTTINNSCADITKCSSFSRNITSTLLNLSILPKKPMKIMMSQCVLIRNQLNTSVPSAFVANDSKYDLQQFVETDTVLSSEDFANIHILMHQSSDLLKSTLSVSRAAPFITTNILLLPFLIAVTMLIIVFESLSWTSGI